MTATEPPFVVIAIVAFSEAPNLVGCLRSLARSHHRRFQVVICENAGSLAFATDVAALDAHEVLCPAATDLPAPVGKSVRHRRWAMRDDPSILVTLLEAPGNLGYAGGVNACLDVADGDGWDALWVLNADTFPEPDALAALIRRQRAGGYGMVGSRMVFHASGLIQTWGGMGWIAWLGRGHLLGFRQPGDITPDIARVERRMRFISGASMFVTAEYVRTVGRMDEDFFMYYEDVEWCLRRGAFRLGYAHDSVVRHIHGSSSGSNTDRGRRSVFNIFLMERNRVLIARKRNGPLWPLLAALALAEIFLNLVRIQSPRMSRIALMGWWAGIRGENGIPRFMRRAPSGDIGSLLKQHQPEKTASQ